MAREIQSRIKVTGTFKAKRSLHVGGVGEDVNVDLALAVNGQGQVYIPGTSLAGALRAWMEQGFGKSLTRQLWGYQETDKTRPQHDKYHYASFVLVEDAVVTLPKKAIIEVREGVGIDRCWGVTANRFQYSRAVIPRGATFPLELTVELKSGKETAAKEALDALLLALSQGDIRLGAAKTRGMGWIELQEGYTAIEQNLRSREGILAILKGTEASYTPNSPAAVAGIQKLTLTVYWKARGPLMVKAEQSGIAVNILPLVGAIGDDTVAFVIPGSSIKGALRSQAERIIRTVCSTRATDDNCPQPFAQHLKVPLVETLFGAASQEQNPNGAKILPGLGALSIEDCYSQHKEPVRVDQWQAVISASKPQDLQTALTEANLTTTQQAFHVAVDRWTGGAAEGFLYSNLEPFDI